MDTKIKYNEDFISVCIPWFNRSMYLDRVLRSMEEKADMPYELIIHDDGSDNETRQALLDNKHRISTLIFNNGFQIGLAASNNRAISLAASKYIVFMNSDCEFLEPFLRRVKETLDKPYVGFISLSKKEICQKHIKTENGRFSLANGIGGGDAVAFRKDTWETIGGYNDNIHCGCSDTPMMYKNYSHGFFRAIIDGQPVKNIDREETQTRNSTIHGHEHMSLPTLFGISKDKYNGWVSERERYCRLFWQKVGNEVQSDLSDIHYWHQYSSDLIDQGSQEVDWEIAKRHGQIRWKDLIEEEVICERESKT